MVGDKGQGMTNVALNVINQADPNSSLKHMMFLIYSGDDNWFNLNSAFKV